MRIRPLSGVGVVGAIVLGSLTVLPSLIPRAGEIQGLILGACAAIGYGLATGSWALTRRPPPRPRWALLAVPGAALVLGWRWQGELTQLMGVPAPGVGWVAVAGVVAVVVFLLLIACARGVRWVTVRLARGLQRVTSPRLATAGAATASALVLLVAMDRVPAALTNGLQPLFTRMNDAAGGAQPTSAVVSGGAASAIPWQALGSQGRTFVAGVTAASDLEAFSGRPARSPIRVFVGLASAAGAEDRAQLAVAELDRFGAFDRAVIAVGTSAGSGTVDPGEVTPLEYLFNGDVAAVSTQYSLLPSFLSFLLDRQDSVEAARTLLSAVRERAAQEPRPPRIVVFGESLGAYGSSSFPDLAAVLDQVDGALWQGPPNSTPLWRTYTAAREPGSPQVRPVYDGGRHLRWANQPADLDSPAGPFEAPRAVFLQNASDPVVWWDWSVLWQRPDWMAEPRGPGLLPWVPWLPVVTFAGLTGDMMDSQGVPPGHGHVYGTDPVYAWADILRVPGWTPADSDRLAQHLG